VAQSRVVQPVRRAWGLAWPTPLPARADRRRQRADHRGWPMAARAGTEGRWPPPCAAGAREYACPATVAAPRAMAAALGQPRAKLPADDRAVSAPVRADTLRPRLVVARGRAECRRHPGGGASAG
jgi:hypothetical protein